MKKQIILITLLVIALSLAGCQAILGVKNNINDEQITSNMNGSSPIAEYYPFLDNTLLEYEGEGNEFASVNTYFEFIEQNRAQIKIMNSGTNMIKVLELTDGALSEIYLEGEFYHIENMINSTDKKKDIIIKEPLELGNTWNNAEGYEKKITSLNAVIETPYKSLEALEITTSFEDGRYQKDYYSKGIGLVARIYIDGEMEVKTLLKAIKKTTMDHDVLVFYPSKDFDKTVFINDKLLFRTNDSIEKLLEYKLKNPPSDDLSISLPGGVVIKSIHLDRSEWVVKVDFTDELLTDLNAGSSYEYQIIKSIVNTLGKYYDTEKVYISIEGRPYESGHFVIREGEAFNVDMEGVEELK